VIQNIKEGIEGHPVGWFSEVFDLVFPELDKEKANICKICEWKEKHGKDKESKNSEDDD
jgi:Lon-like ATP-dependent protease